MKFLEYLQFVFYFLIIKEEKADRTQKGGRANFQRACVSRAVPAVSFIHQIGGTSTFPRLSDKDVLRKIRRLFRNNISRIPFGEADAPRPGTGAGEDPSEPDKLCGLRKRPRKRELFAEKIVEK